MAEEATAGQTITNVSSPPLFFGGFVPRATRSTAIHLHLSSNNSIIASTSTKETCRPGLVFGSESALGASTFSLINCYVHCTSSPYTGALTTHSNLELSLHRSLRNQSTIALHRQKLAHGPCLSITRTRNSSRYSGTPIVCIGGLLVTSSPYTCILHS